MQIGLDKVFYARITEDENGNEEYHPVTIGADIQLCKSDQEYIDGLKLDIKCDSITIKTNKPPLAFAVEQEACLISAWAGIHHRRLYHLLRNKKHRIKKKNAKRIINLYQQSRYYSKT